VLSESQISDFDRQGFLILRNLFSQEELQSGVAHAADMASRAGNRDVRVTSESKIVTEDSGSVKSIFDVHLLQGTAVAQLALHPRLIQKAQCLLGGDVYCHQSRLNFQPPFEGGGFPWHSDFESWHAEDGMPSPRCLSAMVMLDRNVEANGSLMIIPGSHKYFARCAGRQGGNNWETSLRHQTYGRPSAEALTSLVAMEDAGILYCCGDPGDVVLFDANLLHASQNSHSPWPRRNVFIVFNSDENRLGDPFYSTGPRPEHMAHREIAGVLLPLA
jgi:ectoine hydroxylase